MSSKETLKNQILKESAKILGIKGLEGLSLRQVAKDLKVTHQAPYHYFPDKAALLLELKKMGFAQLNQDMSQAIIGKTAIFEKMEALGLSYFDFCLKNPGLFRAMFAPTANGVGVRVSEAQQSFSMVLNCVQQLQSEGYIPNANPEIQAMLCWSSMHGLVSLALEKYPVAGGKYEIRDLARTMLLHLHKLMGRK